MTTIFAWIRTVTSGSSGSSELTDSFPDENHTPPLATITVTNESHAVSNLTTSILDQFSDAEGDDGPVSLYIPMIGKRKWASFAGLGSVVMVSVLWWHGTKHASSEPTTRSDAVDQCLNQLARGMDQEHAPISALQTLAHSVFVHGIGQLIPTEKCDFPGSTFSTVYGILAFRESLKIDLPTWNDDSYNISSISDVCEWKRISCDHSTNGCKEITGLNFNNATFAGSIPSEIRWIHSLQVLRVFDNDSVHGTLPSEIGLLTRLQQLQVHETSIVGHVPSQIGNLKALQSLILYDTGLTGTLPNQVCELRPGLKEIYADCRTSGLGSLVCPCCTRCKYQETEGSVEVY